MITKISILINTANKMDIITNKMDVKTFTKSRFILSNPTLAYILPLPLPLLLQCLLQLYKDAEILKTYS